MARYLLKRIGQSLIVLLILSVSVFLLMSLLPGDPVYAMLGDGITPEQYQLTYHELGLDQPVMTRYFSWLLNVLRGNFGTSYQFHLPVAELLKERVPITIYLSTLATLIAMPLGVLFGVICAVNRGKKIDAVITLVANACSCLPQFWIGIFLMYIFAMKLKLLPSYGFTMPWVDFGKHIRQLIMPLICLSIDGIAGITRQTRSSMLESIRQDYVRTAKAKGLKPFAVTYIHTLKNSLIPIVTLFGVRLSYMVGGSIFVENVFSIPGMGSLLVRAITSKDIPLVQACVLLTSVVTVIAYIITDFIYVLVDPRIKLTKGEG